MKQEATNTFAEGLIMDLNPMTTPNNVMTNALNATLVTFNGNEFSLQNDLGNGRIETAKLPSGFVPVGVQSYGGIIYVASYNPQTGEGQLGSFPSPERNLAQDEISNKQIDVSVEDFKKDGEIFYYYKRYDVMPEGMYLNPGDKFGLFITGSPEEILSYFNVPNARIVTLHPALIDEFGKVNYIDDECKVDGIYQRGLIFDQTPDLGSVDGVRAAFDKCIVYKGKRSGRLSLIVEIETLEDFIVSRGIVSSRSTEDKVESVGSTGIGFSDNKEDTKTDDTKDVSFIVKFYCAGWPKPENDMLDFTGVKFEATNKSGTLDTPSETAYYTITNPDLSMMFAYGGFKKGEGDDTILKYKITPYTQLGPCSALARTGIINFNLLGTGNIILNEWRYYVENNEMRINYGFDLNLLEGESVESVTFTFYDVFFDKVYSKPFICSSTINGNFNGSYNETFTFPYDLKYTDVYKRDVDNHDYIYSEILGGENGETKLQSNELIKNNFYLVKITIKTKGLVTQDGEQDQTSIKEFYRFMYTTGIFNQQYIENEVMNFSTIQVDPYEVRLKAVTDTENVDYEIDYIGGIKENNKEREKVKICTPNSPDLDKVDNTIHKANLYEDWRIRNASITLTGEIENIDSQSQLTGSYYTFGEYNPGWIKFKDGVVTEDNVKVSYNEDNQEILNINGSPSDECIDYIKYNEEEVLSFEETIANIGGAIPEDEALNILGSENFYNETLNEKTEAIRNKQDTTEVNNKLDQYEQLKDTRFYYLDKDSGIIEDDSQAEEGEDAKDPTIKLSNIYGRLIRRVAGNGLGSNMELQCKEVRPCFYPGMSDAELKCMCNFAGINGQNMTLSQALKMGRDYKGSEDARVTIGDPSKDILLNGETIVWDPGKQDGDSYTPDWNDITNAISEKLGGVIQHSFITPLCSGYLEWLEGDSQWGGLGLSNDDQNNSLYLHNKAFTSSDILFWKFQRPAGNTTIVGLCRTNNSTESQPEYVVINFSALGIDNFGDYTQKILSRIYILQKEIARVLHVNYPARIGYSNIYNTIVNAGVSLGTEEGLNIEVLESPVRLYKPKDTSLGSDKGDFSKANVIKNLEGWPDFTSLTEDNKKSIPELIDNEKWFASAEDYTSEEDPTVLQCSWLNIPFPSLKEDFPDENNEDGREIDDKYDITIDPPYPVKFILDNLTKIEDNYYLSSTIELGGNMDASLITEDWKDITDNIKSYVPTYVFIPGTSLDDYQIGSNLDYSGAEFLTTQVYYLVKEDEPDGLIGGNTTFIKDINIFSTNYYSGGSHTCYQRMLVPSNRSDDQFRVPVVISDGSRSDLVTQNLNKGSGGDRRHHELNLKFLVDVYFDLDSSGLYNRSITTLGTEPTS